MKRVPRISPLVALFLGLPSGVAAQQYPDPEFVATVDRPAFADDHPVVSFDAAHHNFHTADNRYKPLADLLKNYGYTIASNTQKFTAEALKSCQILVVSNAQGAAMICAAASFQPRLRARGVRCPARLDRGGWIAAAHCRSSPLRDCQRDAGRETGRGNGQEHDA